MRFAQALARKKAAGLEAAPAGKDLILRVTLAAFLRDAPISETPIWRRLRSVWKSKLQRASRLVYESSAGVEEGPAAVVSNTSAHRTQWSISAQAAVPRGLQLGALPREPAGAGRAVLSGSNSSARVEGGSLRYGRDMNGWRFDGNSSTRVEESRL